MITVNDNSPIQDYIHPNDHTQPTMKDILVEQNMFTALFTNMRILKFKSQLTIAFFAAVNHLNGPLRKQKFSLTGSKGQGL